MSLSMSPNSDGTSPPVPQESSHQPTERPPAYSRPSRHSQDVINEQNDVRRQHIESFEDGDPDTCASDTEDIPSSLNRQDQSSGYKPVATNGHTANSIAGRRNTTSLTTIISDFVILCLPMAAVIFGVLVWSLDGSEMDESFSAWQGATTILATAFPILYAAIIGRLMSESARWKLEKGGSIGLLEQLIGSKTVGSALVSLFQLRAINFLGVVLLLVWSLSPLGAQALLRMLRPGVRSDPSPTIIRYFNTSLPPNSSMLDEGSSGVGDGQARPLLSSQGTLYTLLVTAPRMNKIDTMDLWGNVRIPYMRSHTSKEWVAVPDNRSAIEYSSLAGVPVYYTGERNSTTTFPLESSHIHLTGCNATRFYALKSGAPWTSRANVTENISKIQRPPNGTWRGYPLRRGDLSAQWGVATDTFVDPFWLADVPENTYPFKSNDPNSPAILAQEEEISSRPPKILVRLMMPPGGGNSNRAFDNIEITCDITQQYVESHISCSQINDQRQCQVAKQRASRQKHAAESITHLSFPQVFDFVSRELPLATGRQSLGSTDPSIYYLKDPRFENISNGTAVLSDEIDVENVGVRLGQLINTYLLLSQASEKISTGDVGFVSNITVGGETIALLEIIAVQKLWVSLYLLSSIVLLAGAVLTVIFTHLTYGPETLGYVSTTIRNSKYINLPFEITWMDGPELAKEMKTLRIRHGMVRETTDALVLAVGHEEETERIRDVLSKGRRIQGDGN